MSYSRFALGFSRSRKVSRLSDAAFRLWSSAIDYTREQLTNGFLDEKDLQVIPRGASGGTWKASVVAELVTAGLWIREPNGWQIRQFLDWQDSAEQVRAVRDKARERMRAVRANKSRTSPEVHPTDHILPSDPDHDPFAPVSDPEPAHGSGSTRALDLQTRATVWVEDPTRASLVSPNPEKWPETLVLVAALAEVFGGPQQLPRHASDPRMRALLALWAEGRTMVELEQAIRGAGKDDHYRTNPQFQTLTTILKDSAQVDKFIRLLTVAPSAPAKTSSQAAVQNSHGKTGTENARRL